MQYDITITFTVKRLNNKTEAEETGANLAEHVLDTFNDDESISPLVHITVEKTKKGD